MGRGAVNQKGPEAAFLAALHAIRGAGREAAGEPRAGRRGRGGDRLAALPAGRAPARGAAPRSSAASASSCPRRAQDPDGGVTVSLGAKGVVELELVSSGEKWGRGPDEGRPLQQPRAPRQPGVPPGAGARHAGHRRRRSRHRRLRRRGAAALGGREGDARRGGARGSRRPPRRSCSRADALGARPALARVARALPLHAHGEHRGTGRRLHRARAARPCCRTARWPSSTCAWCPT